MKYISFIQSEYLPRKLVKKLKPIIDSKRDYRAKDNLLLIVGSIYNKQVHEFVDIDSYVPTGSEYWKEIINSNYKKFINQLLDAGIIESIEVEKWTQIDPKSGRVHIFYRVNPDLLDDDTFEKIGYQSSNENGFSGEIQPKVDKETFTINSYSKKPVSISTRKYDALKHITDNYKSLVLQKFYGNRMDNLPDDYHTNYDWIKDGICKTRNGKINGIKKRASFYGQDFFFYNKKYYCAYKNEFIQQKIEATKHRYLKEIHRISSRKYDLIYSRSNSTGRIYNALVNFPNDILHLLRINERPTVQIDLRTSQFLLFANVLNVYIAEGGERLFEIFKTKPSRKYIRSLIQILQLYSNHLPEHAIDINGTYTSVAPNSSVVRFIQDVFSGNFYEIVQKERNISHRDVAKDLIFKIVFSKSLKNSRLIESLLLERYPVVMDIIQDFKKLNGYEQFSIGLQAIESNIFIDKIYKPLTRKGVPCFSRHDSIFVQIGHEEEVEKFMEQIFDSINFKFNRKVECNFWYDIDRKEDYQEKYHKYFEIDFAQTVNGDISEPDNETFTDAIDCLEDEQRKVIELLERKGLLEDYTQAFESGNQLQQLLLLPDITEYQQEILEQEVVNLWSGHLMISQEASRIIREIADRYLC